MKNTRALTISFVLILIIGLMHMAGQYLYLYWRYPGYDRVVHFLGGAWVTFVFLSLLLDKAYFKVHKYQLILLGLGTALTIGLLWEVFELAGKITAVADMGFVADTVGDIISDLLGGLAASLYGVYRYKDRLTTAWNQEK